MKYIMKNCGCRLEKHELTEHNAHGYRCPNHPYNGIDYIEKKCIDCPSIMRLSPKQTTALRCLKCREKIQRKRNKSSYKKRQHRKIRNQDQLVAAAVDAYDCIHRPDCMNEVLLKDPNAVTLPCYGCDRYASAFSAAVHSQDSATLSA